MFNPQVLSVLSQVNGITNSVILKYPQTVAASEAKDVLVLFDIEKLDSDSFQPIGLKDSLSDFLNLFKLFSEDRSVSIDNNTFSIVDGDRSSSYISDNLALMDAYDISPEQFAKTEQAPSVAEFTLTGEDIKSLKSASGVFKDLSEVILNSRDGDAVVSLGATNKFNARSDTYSVTKRDVGASKEFTIKLPVDNFKMIPVSDYDIQIKYNSARDSYRVLLSNKSLEGFKILMSVKAD